MHVKGEKTLVEISNTDPMHSHIRLGSSMSSIDTLHDEISRFKNSTIYQPVYTLLLWPMRV